MSTSITDWNGLSALRIENEFAEAVVTLHGAHIVSFKPRDSRDVLWVSGKTYAEEGRPIRGGIPVCWPWFGGMNQPSHGLARISPWMQTGVTEQPDGSTVLNLAFVPGNADYAFLLANLRITVGKSLEVELETSNNGDSDHVLGEALHTYFSVSEISAVTVSGLDGANYTDSLDKQEKVQKGDISFSCETDRIYHTKNAAKILDPGFRRTILIEKTGSDSTVVWNPWIEKSIRMADFGDEEYHGMVCVETANAGSDVLVLHPGESHRMTMRITEIRDL